MDQIAVRLDNPADSSDPGRHVAVVGRSTMNAAYSITRSRGATSWLLTWTLEGAGRLTQNGVTVDAVRHDLVILGPNTRQRYGTLGERWDFDWFHFQPRPAWLVVVRPWRVGEALYRTRISGGADVDRIDRAFARADRDVRPRRAGRESDGRALDDPPTDTGLQRIHVSPVATTDLLLNAIEEILLVASRNERLRAAAGAASAAGSDPADSIGAAEHAILADPAAPHTIASLAAVATMSPSHFAHEFKRRAGRTPMDAVRAERLSLATHLLRSTDLQIAQVAKAVGYRDPFYFSRLFHRHLGVVPSTYADAAADNPRYRPNDRHDAER